MGSFVVDKSLDVLLRQIDEMAPGRSKSSDGSIGDAAHAQTNSAHNPQDTSDSSDGNDPDNQVDARDFTHDPAHGADMHEITEALRRSRDRRLHLVIFDGRQFSRYVKDGIPAFTWRPYSGLNMHRRHAHVETNDLFNDVTTLWEIGQMSAEAEKQIRDIHYAMFTNTGEVPAPRPEKALTGEVDSLVGGVAELKGMLKVQGEQILALARRVEELTVPVPAPVDPTVLQPVVESGVRAVLRRGTDQA